MISDSLSAQLTDFNLIKINYGKKNDIYFDINLNENNFNKVLENYTKYYNYEAFKQIEYSNNNKKLVIMKHKKYLLENTFIDNQVISLDNVDILITKEVEKKTACSEFSCTKEFHNIQNIETVLVNLNDYCKLMFANKDNINSITIIIKNTNSKNNKLNVNEVTSFISNLIETIQKQLY